ncbi:phospho-sugar mutase [Cryomorpha ignava]|uniref:Phospho-sugar mutase n=1 Tax=Cryomorpha ignava TaxID=101383 RepID=A0A7K3WRI1_9FLAO|nr:phospho-sugar mutase [Cryomorpha ignava]NEN24126.1 phospho-sugar mutase [Cryomorpha ignava]
MDASTLEKARFWASDAFDENTRTEVQNLIDTDQKTLDDAFYKGLEFGTGGLRGLMGAGTNRMNNYTVAMATQGLANYINKNVDGEKSIAIAHDPRNNSHLFARKAAEVMAANGIKAYLFSELRPTPELSFAVRHFKCTAGIVVTASHNPKEYNGYKVYWSDGAQIVAPQDKEIIKEVAKITDPSQVKSDVNAELIEIIGDNIDQLYRDTLKKESIHPEAIASEKDMPIVYTSIHGTGITQVPQLLADLGFENVHIVEEQRKPDGDFPTVHSPNPEEKAALDLALALARKVNAEILMGTDPDADRVGIAVKDLNDELVLLNGNETVSMLVYYQLSQLKEMGKLPENGFVCRTIVTTELVDAIAAHYNTTCYVTLTGFKYIAAKIRELEGKEKFIGGGEESYGYMIGDAVRDKDAVVTGAMLCEIAAWARNNDSSFYQEMVKMYVQFGFYREGLVSIVRKGKDGAEEIKNIMTSYREETPHVIAGSEVVEMLDYLTDETINFKTGAKGKTHQPKSNVIQFYLADGSKVTARPSGTEPKIKFYFSVNAKLISIDDFENTRNKLDSRIEELKDAFIG